VEKEKKLSETFKTQEKEYNKIAKEEEKLRKEIESMHEAQAAELEAVMAAKEAELYTLQARLAGAKAEDIRGEQRMLFRIAEDDAESECIKDFLTQDGREKLYRERALLANSVKMIRAFGYLVPENAPNPSHLQLSRNYREFKEWFAMRWTEMTGACKGALAGIGKKASPIENTSASAANADSATFVEPAAEPTLDKGQGGQGPGEGAGAGEKEMQWEKNHSDSFALPDKTSNMGGSGDGDGGALQVTRVERGSTTGGRDHFVGWDLAMSQLVHTFDTDCSGTFDEGEVRLLLDCVNCALPEKRLLAHFPEVMLDSSDLDKITAYTARRVGWRRGWMGPFGSTGPVGVAMRSSWYTAAMMLVSLSRQRALEFAQKAAALAHVSMDDVEEEDMDVKDSSAAIARAQMLAMRQVSMYLKTTQGVMERKLETEKVRHWWKMDVEATRYSKEGLLRYAYQIHREHKGLLITELPHLVGFLVERLFLKTTPLVDQLAEIMAKVRGRTDMQWFSQTQVLSLLSPMIEDPPAWGWGGPARVAWKLRLAATSFKKDTKSNIFSRARQQSVLIVLNIKNVRVAGTNYRCSVLGLEDIVCAERKKGYFKRRAEQKRRESKKIKVDWINVPREATYLLLMSRGFYMEDMAKHVFCNITNWDHSDGAIAYKRVEIADIVAKSKEGVMFLSFPARLLRWLRFLSWTTIPRYYEYGRMVRMLSWYEAEVKQAGAVYLQELLSGVSHCIAEKDDD